MKPETRKKLLRQHIYQEGVLTDKGKFMYAIAELVRLRKDYEIPFAGHLLKTDNAQELAVEIMNLVLMAEI